MGKEDPWSSKVGLCLHFLFYHHLGFPHSSAGKESVCSAGDPGLIPGSGRSPGEGKGCPLQYSGLGNSMDRGAWWAIVHGIPRVTSDAIFHKVPSLSVIKPISSKQGYSLYPNIYTIILTSMYFLQHRMPWKLSH